MLPIVEPGGIVVTLDSVAINAAVQTTFVSAYIDAFDTVADIPLVLVLPGGDRIAYDLFDQFFIHTQATGYSQIGQVHLPRAGIELDRRILIHSLFERNGHFFDLFLLQRLYVEFAHFAANMLIMVDKAEHTPFRMILEAICYPGKCFFMKRGVVFLISQ